MKAGTQLALVGGGGFLAGAVLVAIAAKRAQAQQAAVQAYMASLPGVQPVFVASSATPPTSGAMPLADPQGNSTTATPNGTLNNGWLYFLTLVTPSGDLTQAANVTALATQLQGLSFVDPNSKQAPTIKVLDPTHGQTLVVFTGTTGTLVPNSTTTLQWASVLGYPLPEGL